MSPLGQRLRAEGRRMLRSRGVVLALVAYAASAALAIGLGHSRLADERAGFSRAEDSVREQLAHLGARYGTDADLGYMGYYLELPTAYRTDDVAALAAGARDTIPAGQRVRPLGLVPQLYEDTMNNPTARAAGGFDLAFVIAMLAPLVLLVLGHDASAREDDLGTAALVDAMPRSRAWIACERVLVAGAVVTAVVVLVSVAGWLAVGGGLDRHAGAWVAVSVAYLAFWTLVLLAIVLATRTAAAAALASAAAWLGLCVVVPAATSALAAGFSPAVDTGAILLAQRERMNDAWDEPKAAAMTPFRQRWPDLAGTEVPGDRFSWMWYYAMHDNADASVAALVAEREAALAARERWLERAALASPAAAAGDALAQIVGTDAGSRDAYLRSIESYHHTLERRLFPDIFAGAPLSSLDAASVPRHAFAAAPGLPRAHNWSGLGAASLVAGALVVFAWRRREGAQSTPGVDHT